MIFRSKTRLVAAAFLLASASTSFAQASTSMETTGFTTQPIGHYDFCKAKPRECQKSAGRKSPETLTRAMWSSIVNINNKVNTTVRPLTDMEIWGREEVWSYPGAVGDCEDFVLLKRSMLMDAGISPANLLVTVVRQANGDGHAVLTVRTDRGEFILDNLVGEIRDWRDTEYEYLKRQSSEHAGRWVSINDNRPKLVKY